MHFNLSRLTLQSLQCYYDKADLYPGVKDNTVRLGALKSLTHFVEVNEVCPFNVSSSMANGEKIMSKLSKLQEE